jgi:hypothetical protein
MCGNVRNLFFASISRNQQGADSFIGAGELSCGQPVNAMGGLGFSAAPVQISLT